MCVHEEAVAAQLVAHRMLMCGRSTPSDTIMMTHHLFHILLFTQCRCLH